MLMLLSYTVYPYIPILYIPIAGTNYCCIQFNCNQVELSVTIYIVHTASKIIHLMKTSWEEGTTLYNSKKISNSVFNLTLNYCMV